MYISDNLFGSSLDVYYFKRLKSYKWTTNYYVSNFSNSIEIIPIESCMFLVNFIFKFIVQVITSKSILGFF